MDETQLATKLAAMEAALAAYEAEFGPISDEEALTQREQDRANAVMASRPGAADPGEHATSTR